MVGRSFGDGVRDAIPRAGLTQRRLAELLGWEKAKVSDLVKGKGGVTEVELAMLLGLRGVGPDEARRLLALYRETLRKGYLELDADGVPNQLRTLIERERHSGTSSDCVEVGYGVGIRDSKAPTTHLPVSDKAWSAFLTEVKASR
ncbi:hypothetical protein GCM10027200_31100 [Lentzea nigeriaca]